VNDVDLDFDRGQRIGVPEVVYGQHKSAAQLQEVARRLAERGANLLVTRCTPEQVNGIEGDYDPVARTFLCLRQQPITVPGLVGVVYAGTSDAPVAREAINTLTFLGCENREFGDCGVAGIHRLMAHRDALQPCHVLICCAGFEGALASNPAQQINT